MSSCSGRPACRCPGLLSVPGSTGDIGGNSGEHHGAASSAYGAADAPVALCLQDGTDLNFATRLQRARHHRHEPDDRGNPGPSPARQLCRQRRRPAAGASRLRRSSPPPDEDRVVRGCREVPAHVAALARRPRGPDDRGEDRVRAGSGFLRTVRPAASPSVDAGAGPTRPGPEPRSPGAVCPAARLPGHPADRHSPPDVPAEVLGAEEAARPHAAPERGTRIALVTLPATANYPDAAPVTALHLLETDPPTGEFPVEWFLLTDLPVDHAARETVGWYALRWRMLVPGAEVRLPGGTPGDAQGLPAGTADHDPRRDRLASFRAGRSDDRARLPVLGLGTPLPLRLCPPIPAGPTLGAAVTLVAILGGYLNRKHDPLPGDQTMWLSATGHRHAGL